jgi:hypothetical protein
MFAVRPLPTVNDEYGSRSKIIGDNNSYGDKMNGDCMDDSDKLAIFGRIHDALSPKRNRTGPKNLLVY